MPGHPREGEDPSINLELCLIYEWSPASAGMTAILYNKTEQTNGCECWHKSSIDLYSV